MTTFAIPAAPKGPVWLTRDDNLDAPPVRYMVRGDGLWQNDADEVLDWRELLALGEVDDEYHGAYDLHGTATPWSVIDDCIIVGADGDQVAEVRGASTATDDDRALAALIVQLVNAHATEKAAGPAVDNSLDDAADTLALAVNDVVLRWQRATLSTRVKVNDVCPGLGELLKAQCNAHAAVNR